MATAGSIVIDLLVRTGSFLTDLDRARKKVDETAKSIDRAVIAIGAAAAGFTTAAAAIAVQSARAMDATAKMAQQIGVTTESLTSLRFAAQQFANVSDQTFDMAMRRMTRRIEEAAAGSGAAKEALKALGLSAKELAQISPDRQFLALADALSKTESQAARLRFTMALLDTEGVPLVTALQQGSRSLEEAAQQAERFGIVLSTDVARAAELFATNLDHLGRAQEGIKQQITGALLPSLVTATSLLLEMADAAGPIGEKVERALTLAGVAATGAAAIFAGRLVGAATAASASLLTASGAAIKSQYELARLAGASRVASVGLVGVSTAARGVAAVLTVVGGPLGLITTLLTAGAAAWVIWGRDASRAQGQISALTQSMEDLNHEFLMLSRNKREQMLMGLEEDMRSLQGEIDRSIDKLREMSESAADWAAMPEGMRPIYQSLRDDIQAVASSSLDADEKTAILKARIEGLEGIVPGDVYRKMLEIALAAATGAEEVSELMSRIQKLQEQIDAPVMLPPRRIRPSGGGSDFEKELKSLLDKLLPAEAALRDYHKSLNMILSAHQSGRLSIAQYTTALQNLNLAYAKQVNDLLPESIKKAQEQVKAAREQQKQLEQQLRTFGLAESAVLALAAADTDSAIAKLEAAKASEIANGATAERIAQIKAEIQVLRELRDLQLGSAGLQGQLEWREQQREQWQAWAQDVKTIFDQVGQSLTDALFEGGKSGLDLLKDWAKTLTLRIFVQPVMSGLQAMVTGVGPGGIAAGGSAAGGMMGSPTSLFSMFGGNSMGMGMSNVMSHLSTSSMLQGTGVGNWLMGQAGNVAGMSNLALGGAGLLGGLGANLIFGGKGHSGIGGGLGSTLGMALGGPLGAVAGTLIGGGLGSLFGDREPTTRREQRTQVEYAGGIFDVTKVDDRAPAGADAAARALAEQAVQTANDIFKQVGVDAAIDSFHAIMASSYKGDRDGVASGGRLRLGDQLIDFGIDLNDPNPTIQGFGGWSSVDPMQRIGTEIQLSMLEAFQAVSDELPNVLASMLEGIDVRSLGEQEAQALAERFTMLTQGASQFLAAIDAMPFAELRDLSFDAAAAMVQFAGGIDNLLAAQQTYYQRFYSDAERHAHSVDQIAEALAGVGVEMPALTGSTEDMLASYRALVESLDLNTEAGQQAYVMLMQNAGAFADVAEFAGQAAVEAARYAEQVLREREGLERQLLQLQGDTAELRRRELAALDESNHALQERIWRMRDEAQAAEEAARAIAEAEARAKEIQQERYGLETQLLQLMGDTDTLRARQLATLDESNHALQRRIWALQDEAQAAQDAERAAKELADGQKRLRDLAIGAGESAYSALSRAVQAERDRIRQEADRIAQALGDAIASASDAVSRLEGLTGRLSSTVSSMMQSGLDERRNREWAQERISRALSVATLTGIMPEGEDFESALQIVAQPSEGLWDSFEDYQADFLRTAHEVDALRLLADDQLTTERRTLKTLEDQLAHSQSWYDSEMARLDQTLEHWRDQLDIAAGTYQATLSVEDAVLGVASAVRSVYSAINGLRGVLAPEASYAVGTSYVPRNMLANIHEGEAVIDRSSMDVLRTYGIRVYGGGGNTAALERKVEALQREQERTNRLLETIATNSKRTADDAGRIADGEATLKVGVDGPVGTVIVEDWTVEA